MNESLRRALIQARLREEDVAARLNVDPKTVRRWLAGRVPYPGNRAALAALVRVEEADLWPEAAGPLADRTRPEELIRVYPAPVGDTARHLGALLLLSATGDRHPRLQRPLPRRRRRPPRHPRPAKPVRASRCALPWAILRARR